MTVNDIIVLLTLIIATIAIINEKNRGHLLLKFRNFEIALFFISFLLVNYFVFYGSFYSRGIFFQRLYFQNWGFKNPKNYAYLISLIALFSFYIKIWYSFYPFSKIDKVSQFYKRQIENNELTFLIDLLQRYHSRDIVRLIESTPNYDANNLLWPNHLEIKTRKQRFYDWVRVRIVITLPKSWLNRKVYARMVLNNVINNPNFLSLTANNRPYFFAELFQHFKEDKRDAFPKELINMFLSELIQHKSFWLKKELINSQDHDYGQPSWFFDDNKILGALFHDLSISDVNEVWLPFGEAAMSELEEERTNGYDSKMFNEFREEQLLWVFKTQYTIQFFKVLVIEGIVKGYSKSCFWLYYYDRIVGSILKTFDTYVPLSDNSVYHKFVDTIVDTLFLWLELVNKNASDGFSYCVSTCLGQVINVVTNGSQIENRKKVELVERLITMYCNLADNKETGNLRIKIETILLKPAMGVQHSHPYYTYFKSAWIKFDKVPHRFNQEVDYDYFARLKDSVIVPLGLDPSQP